MDEEDYGSVQKHTWYTKDGYQGLFHANIDGKLVSLGRYVLSLNNIEVPKNCIIKHIDGNVLNNTKSNLLVTSFHSIIQHSSSCAVFGLNVK